MNSAFRADKVPVITPSKALPSCTLANVDPPSVLGDGVAISASAKAPCDITASDRAAAFAMLEERIIDAPVEC